MTFQSRHFIICIIFLISGSAFGRQEASIDIGFSFIYPPEPPAHPRAKAAAESDAENDARLARMRAMREMQQEQERVENLILSVRYQRFRDQQPPIDPSKDQYRKFCEDRRRMAEDPDFAAMRPTRDDFRDWKKAETENPREPLGPERKSVVKGGIDALQKALNALLSPETTKQKPQAKEVSE